MVNIINLNNLSLNLKVKKFNFILGIFLEKQLFYFICLYLFFFQRIFNAYSSRQILTKYRDYLMKFCNKFRISILSCFIYDSFIWSIRQVFKNMKAIKPAKQFKCEILNKRKAEYKKVKKNKKGTVTLSPDLEFKDFYFKKFLLFGKHVHSSLFFYRKRNNKTFSKFKNFTLIMLRFFKFKVMYSIFFRLQNHFPKNYKFISFLGLRRVSLALKAGQSFVRDNSRFSRKMFYFVRKYKSMVRFSFNISTESSKCLNFGKVYTQSSDYFIARLSDRLNIKKKLYLVATGRRFFYRFSKSLSIPVLFKFTKYKLLNSLIAHSKRLNDYNKCLRHYKRKVSVIIKKSEYIKKRLSNNYFVKKPIQKLIISGKKKLGYNIFNNLFLSMSKVYKGSMLKQVEMVNLIFKRLFIRATVKNIERNNSALGVKQRCSLLMGYEELKSRVNLFFFDYTRSLCKKKTKLFRVRKLKDLIFSDFFNYSLRNKFKKSSTHLAKVFFDITEFMMKELNFRGIFKVYRYRNISIRKRNFKYRRYLSGAKLAYFRGFKKSIRFRKLIYYFQRLEAIDRWESILLSTKKKYTNIYTLYNESKKARVIMGARYKAMKDYLINQNKFAKPLKLANFINNICEKKNTKFFQQMYYKIYKDFKAKRKIKKIKVPFINSSIPTELAQKIRLKLIRMYKPNRKYKTIKKKLKIKMKLLKEKQEYPKRYNFLKKMYKRIYRNSKKKIKRYLKSKRVKYQYHIKKALRIKVYVYGNDILANALPNLVYKKSHLFARKCRIFLNKSFIVSRFGNFKFTKNWSRFKNFKIFRNLGTERANTMNRFCKLICFRSNYYTRLYISNLKYSYKAYRKKFVSLDFKTINYVYKLGNTMKKFKTKTSKDLRIIFKNKLKRFLKFRFERSPSARKKFWKNMSIFKNKRTVKKIKKITNKNRKKNRNAIYAKLSKKCYVKAVCQFLEKIKEFGLSILLKQKKLQLLDKK